MFHIAASAILICHDDFRGCIQYRQTNQVVHAGQASERVKTDIQNDPRPPRAAATMVLLLKSRREANA
jgi:hypothetical protein